MAVLKVPEAATQLSSYQPPSTVASQARAARSAAASLASEARDSAGGTPATKRIRQKHTKALVIMSPFVPGRFVARRDSGVADPQCRGKS